MPAKTIAPKEYAEGEIFRYRGNPFELRLRGGTVPEGARKVSISGDGYLSVQVSCPDDAKRFILYWYTEETEKIARSLVPAWSKKLQVRPRVVAVKYARTRWGSCSSAGRVFLNSRLAMLTDDVAEYVVVHELCHLKQMNHSKEFWNEVQNAIPSAMSLRRSLRAQEREAVL
jgi:predicted metal-dependent hydrolase